MPGYRYQATDHRGKLTSGVLEAANPAAARAAIRERRLALVTLTADGGSKARGGKLSLRSLTLVTRQLSTLTGSGLRIEEALQTIAGGQPAKVAAVILNIRTALTEGRSLADALADHPASFSEFYRASVKAGEQAGRLDKVLGHLAEFVENRTRNRQTVMLALLYPALLGVVSLGIVTMLMVFVVPDIVKVFTSRGAALPFVTRLLIGISGWVRTSGPLAALVLALAAFGGTLWLRRGANRQKLHEMMAKNWATRRFVQRMNAAQFAGTLATLVQSGVPLVAALEAAGDATPNLYIRAQIVELTQKVRQGSALRPAMEAAGCFPPMLVAMVASGEANGRLGQALDHAATDQQRDLDAWVKAVVALVEPGILLIMGGMVMTIVLAILLPIVSMSSLVSP
ncbi:MAG: type II secretion system F family protein [bacterium]